MFDFITKNWGKNNKKISKSILEELLLEADVDYEIVEEIIYYLPPSDEIKKEDLKRVMQSYFIYDKPTTTQNKPFVQLVLGVNGAGKTTSIAKLAYLYKNQNKKVILGACDTFRAGAIEQLRLWAKKLNIEIVSSMQGHDPSAIAFDTISKAISKSYDNVIIDTAGRLENQKNLAAELEKIVRISNKALEGAPHQKILVLDGTTGTAGINQAKIFNELIKLDGVIITKLDGTAKGGALLSIARELELAILYVGNGEKEQDLKKFDANEYINNLVDFMYS